MRIRNTGESLSRPFPRLQRTRQCRGRTSHSDVKRRTSKCTPSPYRAASGLPPLLPAATPVSNTPTCRCFPPPYIHRHRDASGTTSISYLAPSLHVSTLSIYLRRGLPAAPTANCRTQAQSSRRLTTRASSKSRAATQPLRTSNGKRLTTARAPGILPPAVSPAARPAFYPTSHSPSPSSQPTSQ